MTTFHGGDPYVHFLAACRALRRNATDAEALLWRVLRNRRLGVKFRRQHAFGPYILDFSCAALRLAVEVDGAHHAVGEQAAYDAERSAALAGAGVRVLRFTNRAVLVETEGVAAALWVAVGSGSEGGDGTTGGEAAGLHPHPSPLPEGEGIGATACW